MAEQSGTGDDRKLLVCMPWSLEVFTRIRGSATGECSYCGAGVVISPEGQQILADEAEIQVACVSCSLKESDEDETIEIPPAVRARGRAVTGKDVPEIFDDSPKEVLEALKRQEERRSNS
jgi:L-lactate utilization protein LutB